MTLTYVWRFQAIFPVFAVLQVSSLASLVAYVIYFVDRDPRRSIENLKNPLSFLFVALVFVMVLSIPGSLWPQDSLRFLFPYLTKTFVFALLLAASIRTFADVERLVGVHVLGASIYALTVVVTTGLDYVGRATGFGGHDPNDYAMHMAIALPKSVRIGVGVLIVLVGGLVAKDRYWESMSTLFRPTQDYNWTSPTGRVEVWGRGVGYMLQRPVLGVGVGKFEQAEGTLSAESEQRDRQGLGWKWSSPHNTFLEIGAELGLLGLGIFVALFAYAFRTLLFIARAPPQTAIQGARGKAIAQALIGSLIAYVVAGSFLSHAYTAITYALLALVAGLAKAHSLDYERRSATRPRLLWAGAGSPSPPATRRARR
jgi:O-antigen ligase